MTMVYCRTCGRDVHITHGEDECEGEPNKSTPASLKREAEMDARADEPARDPPDVF